MVKYSDLSDQYTFSPVAVETLGPFHETAYELVVDLGRRIASLSGDDRENSFFVPAFVCGRGATLNSILLHDSFSVVDRPD